MTNNESFRLNLCVAFFIEIFTFANVGIRRSFLQYYCNRNLPMLLLDTFENVISGIKFYDKQNYEKLEHLLKHALLRNHQRVDLSNMKIIDSSFYGNKLKRIISEALSIKQYRPSLNSQEQSVKLKLFNYFYNFIKSPW